MWFGDLCVVMVQFKRRVIHSDTIRLANSSAILQGKIADNKKLEGKLDYEKIWGLWKLIAQQQAQPALTSARTAPSSWARQKAMCAVPFSGTDIDGARERECRSCMFYYILRIKNPAQKMLPKVLVYMPCWLFTCFCHGDPHQMFWGLLWLQGSQLWRGRKIQTHQLRSWWCWEFCVVKIDIRILSSGKSLLGINNIKEILQGNQKSSHRKFHKHELMVLGRVVIVVFTRSRVSLLPRKSEIFLRGAHATFLRLAELQPHEGEEIPWKNGWILRWGVAGLGPTVTLWRSYWVTARAAQYGHLRLARRGRWCLFFGTGGWFGEVIRGVWGLISISCSCIIIF